MKATSVKSGRFTSLGARSAMFLIADLSPKCPTEDHREDS